MTTHIVTAPLVIATTTDGSQVYLYKGAVVTSGLRAGEVKRLTDEGLLEQFTVDEPEPQVQVQPDPPIPAPEPVAPAKVAPAKKD